MKFLMQVVMTVAVLMMMPSTANAASVDGRWCGVVGSNRHQLTLHVGPTGSVTGEFMSKPGSTDPLRITGKYTGGTLIIRMGDTSFKGSLKKGKLTGVYFKVRPYSASYGPC